MGNHDGPCVNKTEGSEAGAVEEVKTPCDHTKSG